ncbi:hypothetical protein ACRRTK_007481 [Alexandromys fortis]
METPLAVRQGQEGLWIPRASSCRGRRAVWPLLPRWLERSYQPPTQAQGSEEKPIGTPNWFAAAGSKHTGPSPAAASLALEVTELKGALATLLRDFAQQGSGLEGAEAWLTGQ